MTESIRPPQAIPNPSANAKGCLPKFISGIIGLNNGQEQGREAALIRKEHDAATLESNFHNRVLIAEYAAALILIGADAGIHLPMDTDFTDQVQHELFADALYGKIEEQEYPDFEKHIREIREGLYVATPDEVSTWNSSLVSGSFHIK